MNNKKEPLPQKILYIDMDGVIVDFTSAFAKLDNEILNQYKDNEEDIPGIFSLMEAMPDAIQSVELLAKHFDIYILSTAPWDNSSAWTDKIDWLKKYLPEVAYKKLILSHNKNLNKGDYLIDDRLKHGVTKFEGEHIHFGEGKFPNWNAVVEYLIKMGI